MEDLSPNQKRASIAALRLILGRMDDRKEQCDAAFEKMWHAAFGKQNGSTEDDNADVCVGMMRCVALYAERFHRLNNKNGVPIGKEAVATAFGAALHELVELTIDDCKREEGETDGN